MCTEGTSTFGYDVIGAVNENASDGMKFYAVNKAFGQPSVTVTIGSDAGGTEFQFGVGETHDYGLPSFRMRVTREPDSQWKNFEADLLGNK